MAIGVCRNSGGGAVSMNENIPVSSLSEMDALHLAIVDADYEILRVQRQLTAMHKKQIARQHELGYQKARIGLRPCSKISDDAKPGHRMVIVQTEAGIATRWIPEKAEVAK